MGSGDDWGAEDAHKVYRDSTPWSADGLDGSKAKGQKWPPDHRRVLTPLGGSGRFPGGGTVRR